MKTRFFTLFLALLFALSFTIISCEVDEGSDATDGISNEEVQADVEEDGTMVDEVSDPCAQDDACNIEDCVIQGEFDPDCAYVCYSIDMTNADPNKQTDNEAKEIIKELKTTYGYADQLPNEDNCNFNEGICEAQFQDSTVPCFCDPDCIEGDFQPCQQDGHCDTWCTAGFDPDCK